MAFSWSKQATLNSLGRNQSLSKLTSLSADVWIAIIDIHPCCTYSVCCLECVGFSPLRCSCNSGNILSKIVNGPSQVSLRKKVQERWEPLKSRIENCQIVRANRVTAWVWESKCCAALSQGSASPLFKEGGESSNSKLKLTIQTDRKHHFWVKQEKKTWKTVRLTVVYALQIFQTQEKLRK